MTVAPETLLLPLLPSGPDGVRGVSPHGAGPPSRGSPLILAKIAPFASDFHESPFSVHDNNENQTAFCRKN